MSQNCQQITHRDIWGPYPTGDLPSINTAFLMPLGRSAKYWRSHHPPALWTDPLGHWNPTFLTEPMDREILRLLLYCALPVTPIIAHARFNAQRLPTARHSSAATTTAPQTPVSFCLHHWSTISAWRLWPRFPRAWHSELTYEQVVFKRFLLAPVFTYFTWTPAFWTGSVVFSIHAPPSPQRG